MGITGVATALWQRWMKIPYLKFDDSKIDMGSGSVFEEMTIFKFSIKKQGKYFLAKNIQNISVF